MHAHDRLAHFVFTHPHHAAAWIRARLPPNIAAAVDWPTFRPAADSIPGVRLRSHRADFVFTALLHDGRVVLFLIEHKSGPDAALGLQMLRYEVHLLHVHDRSERPVPFVVGLVLTRGLAPKQQRSTELPMAVRQYLDSLQPHTELLVHDLAAVDEADLRAEALPPLVTMALVLMRLGGAPATAQLAALARCQDLLRAIERDPGPPAAADALDALGWYLLDSSDLTEQELTMALERHLDDPANAPRTTGRRLLMEARAEGKAEGKAEGIASGRAELLRQLLEQRFEPLTPAMQRQLLEASPAELDRYARRLLQVDTLADVFAPGG
jgi:hypothetical protein